MRLMMIKCPQVAKNWTLFVFNIRYLEGNTFRILVLAKWKYHLHSTPLFIVIRYSREQCVIIHFFFIICLFFFLYLFIYFFKSITLLPYRQQTPATRSKVTPQQWVKNKVEFWPNLNSAYSFGLSWHKNR